MIIKFLSIIEPYKAKVVIIKSAKTIIKEI